MCQEVLFLDSLAFISLCGIIIAAILINNWLEVLCDCYNKLERDGFLDVLEICWGPSGTMFQSLIGVNIILWGSVVAAGLKLLLKADLSLGSGDKGSVWQFSPCSWLVVLTDESDFYHHRILLLSYILKIHLKTPFDDGLESRHWNKNRFLMICVIFQGALLPFLPPPPPIYFNRIERCTVGK